MPLFATRRRLPELAAGLPSNFDEAKEAFDARVKSRFPRGSTESELIREVEAQGFKLSSPFYSETGEWHAATLYRRRLALTTIWSLRWRSVEGRIEEVLGVYGFRGP
jgi:hypothetical protein